VSPFDVWHIALNPIIIQACRQSGFTPRIAAQSSQIDFIIELVPQSSASPFSPG